MKYMESKMQDQIEGAILAQKEEGRHLVRFIGASDAQNRWGGNDDPRELLVEGEVYEVERIEVHSWHTKYELAKFPGKVFNSVCFADISGDDAV